MSDKQRIILALKSVVPNVITNQCCSTCSTSGIPDGAFAYFHAQDIERAFSIDGDKPVGEARINWGEDEDDTDPEGDVQSAEILVAPLLIGYGTDTGTDETVTPIRLAIIEALRGAYFVVEDPGTNDHRIKVTGVDGVAFS